MKVTAELNRLWLLQSVNMKMRKGRKPEQGGWVGEFYYVDWMKGGWMDGKTEEGLKDGWIDAWIDGG